MSWPYIYDSEWTVDPWNIQPQHKLELGHQDVDSSCRGEAGHQRVRQVHDNKAHLENTHGELRGSDVERKEAWVEKSLDDMQKHWHGRQKISSQVHLENPHEEGDR